MYMYMYRCICICITKKEVIICPSVAYVCIYTQCTYEHVCVDHIACANRCCFCGMAAYYVFFFPDAYSCLLRRICCDMPWHV